jgi:hypothetical protein
MPNTQKDGYESSNEPLQPIGVEGDVVSKLHNFFISSFPFIRSCQGDRGGSQFKGGKAYEMTT